MMKFIIAYFDVYRLNVYELLIVVSEVFFCKANMSKVLKNYISIFMQCYRNMKEYKLDEEIHEEIRNGNSFFGACQEYDIY